jgi:hypothetical protein
MKKLILALILIPTFSLADYKRENWRHWSDLDKDGLNTRQEILMRDFDMNNQFWITPYLKKEVRNAGSIDIDHIVPLKEAYLSGGKNWSKEEKEKFANDEENLTVSYLSANRKKGSKDIAEWLPDYNKCWYIEKFTKIKEKYQLTLDKEEKKVIKQYKKICKTN